MLLTLLSHEWKSFWRARNAGANLAVNIVAGLLVLYFLAIAVSAGVFMARILEKIFPDQDLVFVFCGFMLYDFSFDILVRFQLQELSTIFIQPYLVLDIRRKQILNFLHIRSLLSIFNVLPFVLLVPFIVLRVYPQNGLLPALALIAAIFFITIFNHFLVMFVKRKATLSGWWLAGFLVCGLLFAGADYKNIFSIRALSALLFTPLLKYPALCLVPAVLALGAVFNDRRFLLSNMYLDEVAKPGAQKTSADYTWLNRFGVVGELVGIELKLVLRNKRARNALRSSLIFLFYGFFTFKTRRLDSDSLSIAFVGSMLVTGTFILQYAYLIFSAQSGFFDGLMTSNISIRDYIKAKMMFLTAISTVAFLISVFYGFISWKIIPVEIAAYLFNLGITLVLCVYFGTMNFRAVDIEKSAAFTQKGTGFANFMFPLAVCLIGLMLYWPFQFFINPWAGIAAIALAGIICFLLRDRFLNIIVRQFISNRYKMLQGFREKV